MININLFCEHNIRAVSQSYHSGCLRVRFISCNIISLTVSVFLFVACNFHHMCISLYSCTVCQPFSFSSHEHVFLVTCICLMATFFCFNFLPGSFWRAEIFYYSNIIWQWNMGYNEDCQLKPYMSDTPENWLQTFSHRSAHTYIHRFYSVSSVLICRSKKFFLKSEHYTDFYTTLFLQFITVYLYTWIEPSCWT